MSTTVGSFMLRRLTDASNMAKAIVGGEAHAGRIMRNALRGKLDELIHG